MKIQFPSISSHAATGLSSGFPAPQSAYIHIPFCRRRCYYCDFPVSVVGDQVRGETSGAIAHYVEVLCQEILTAPGGNLPLTTIFFGGGTPSLLSIAQVQQILKTLDQHLGIAAGAEISMEMDPGTFDRAHLQGYQSAGISRVSLGAQSFDGELLKACGRTHTPEEIERAVELIRQVGIANFSLDLISGLPRQTLTQWEFSLRRAIALNPAHISVYDLTIEPTTAFGRWYQPGDNPLPSDETTAQMYRLTQATLTPAGYAHYEISNYARPGYQCQHNRVYWENRSYYGFGMGAASYVQGQRFTRPRKRSEYFQWVQDLITAGGAIACPATTPEDELLETLMLGLRLAEGLSLVDLIDRFGQARLRQILQCLQPYQQQGWVAVVDASGQAVLPEAVWQTGAIAPDVDAHPTNGLRLRLTDPEGFLFSNVVLSKLFEKLS